MRCLCRGDITAVAFHPQQQLLASTGSEGELRIWALVQGRQPHGPANAQQSHWRCRSVATYRGGPAAQDWTYAVEMQACYMRSPQLGPLLIAVGCRAAKHVRRLTHSAFTAVQTWCMPASAVEVWMLVCSWMEPSCTLMGRGCSCIGFCTCQVLPYITKSQIALPCR